MRCCQASWLRQTTPNFSLSRWCRACWLLSCWLLCSALPVWISTDKCQISSSHWSGYQQDRLHGPMGRQEAGMTKYGSSWGLCCFWWWWVGESDHSDTVAVVGCWENIENIYQEFFNLIRISAQFGFHFKEDKTNYFVQEELHFG